ncbi:MAG TPA: electron transfer flavoprotein subunit beta [Legionellales bacterium]|nr:electron transfer flavoprotein subunit beta [Legionellales bacterium]
MKILVPVKRVVDPYARIRVKADGSGVELQQIKMVMNPFDEIALEEAIRLREKGVATSVVIVSIGEEVCQETLRHGLALGADEAILVENAQSPNSFEVAKILEKVVQEEQPQLVMMGKQAIDSDANQTPQMLAALLDWPQATFISNIEIKSESIEVTRETDAGLEVLDVMLPAVISVDLRLNEPRYATLPNIMRAKSKPLKTLNVDLSQDSHQLKLDALMSPPIRQKGAVLSSVDELFEKIKPVLFS